MKRGKDPRTGKFTKGNPGRPRGTKNARTLQWEELGKEITEANAAKFNDLLGRLWDSRDINDQVRAAELFLKMVEYFKPKLQRINTPDIAAPFEPPRIVIERHIIGADGTRRIAEDERYTPERSLIRN